MCNCWRILSGFHTTEFMLRAGFMFSPQIGWAVTITMETGVYHISCPQMLAVKPFPSRYYLLHRGFNWLYQTWPFKSSGPPQSLRNTPRRGPHLFTTNPPPWTGRRFHLCFVSFWGLLPTIVGCQRAGLPFEAVSITQKSTPMIWPESRCVVNGCARKLFIFFETTFLQKTQSSRQHTAGGAIGPIYSPLYLIIQGDGVQGWWAPFTSWLPGLWPAMIHRPCTGDFD